MAKVPRVHLVSRRDGRWDSRVRPKVNVPWDGRFPDPTRPDPKIKRRVVTSVCKSNSVTRECLICGAS